MLEGKTESVKKGEIDLTEINPVKKYTNIQLAAFCEQEKESKPMPWKPTKIPTEMTINLFRAGNPMNPAVYNLKKRTKEQRTKLQIAKYEGKERRAEITQNYQKLVMGYKEKQIKKYQDEKQKLENILQNQMQAEI